MKRNDKATITSKPRLAPDPKKRAPENERDGSLRVRSHVIVGMGIATSPGGPTGGR